MTRFLVSFPASAMDVPAHEMAAVSDAAHAVIREAKAAGVYVFGGGINDKVGPVLVDVNGAVTDLSAPPSRPLDGGFCVLALPSREAAIEWAAKLARACRCPQELRQFHDDPES